MLDDQVIDAISRGIAAAALRAGLGAGKPAFTQHIAERAASIGKAGVDPSELLLDATLVLVAEHPEAGVVATLVAYPPISVIANLLNSHATGADPEVGQGILLAGATMIARVRALAVADEWRRHRIGADLLDACYRIYKHCGYRLMYGQMESSRSGLANFYRRCGFQVLEPGAGFDAWVVFGIHTKIHPQPDEQTFLKGDANIAVV